MWSYKGVDVFRADMNASGIRWYARTPTGMLRADSKVSMRHMISELFSDSSRVTQTACKHCGQDIENVSPYPSGEWRDRGSNTHCPTPEGDAGQVHEPAKERLTILYACGKRVDYP